MLYTYNHVYMHMYAFFFKFFILSFYMKLVWEKEVQQFLPCIYCVHVKRTEGGREEGDREIKPGLFQSAGYCCSRSHLHFKFVSVRMLEITGM